MRLILHPSTLDTGRVEEDAFVILLREVAFDDAEAGVTSLGPGGYGFVYDYYPWKDVLIKHNTEKLSIFKYLEKCVNEILLQVSEQKPVPAHLIFATITPGLLCEVFSTAMYIVISMIRAVSEVKVVEWYADRSSMEYTAYRCALLYLHSLGCLKEDDGPQPPGKYVFTMDQTRIWNNIGDKLGFKRI
jgi:hypothetical protein